MLKVRIIGVLTVKNGIVVQSVGFKRYLPVGSIAIAIEYLNKWGIDEIVVLDIDATATERKPLFGRLMSYSRFCQVPLAIGGGITSIDDIKRAIHGGADKIVVNTAAFEQPELIEKGASIFGKQCIVVSIDAKRTARGKYETYVRSGSIPTGFTPAKFARHAQSLGAGEIFLNSIDRDGSKRGYDTELIRSVVDAVNIPVIVCGGANHPRHMLEAMQIDVSAVAAANFFHYTEHSVIIVKSYLCARSADIRHDSYVTYGGFSFDGTGRLRKKEENLLDRLYVEFIPEEVI